MFPLEFRGALAPYVPLGIFRTLAYTITATRIMGLSSSEDRMIVAGVVLA